MEPEVPTLSTFTEQLLHQQQISESSPGTILSDFQMLLDFIGTKGIEVSQRQNFLSIKSLAELNSRLTHPLQIDLKRPQQKSYPHLHGLYLLLRASTLSYIQPKGKKFFLSLEHKVLDSWDHLNPTERYFNLLEAWWIWGTEEILGERDWISGFQKCLMFWLQIPPQGKKVKSYGMQQDYNYSPGVHHLALLEMFGLLEIKHVKPQAGKGWRFTKLKKTPWGDALLALILSISYQQKHQEEEEETEPFGSWQSAVKPFFPEWQQNITIPEPEKQEGVYIFKVSLGKIWRRIAIPSDYSLYDLSSIILESVNFDDDHLHQFDYRSRYGWRVQVNHPYSNEPPFTHEFIISDLSLSLQSGQSLTYLFDFGDNWEFNVQLERIEADNFDINEPTILACNGEAPEQYPSWDEEDWDEEDWDEEK